jgi:hypothetical protein
VAPWSSSYLYPAIYNSMLSLATCLYPLQLHGSHIFLCL